MMDATADAAPAGSVHELMGSVRKLDLGRWLPGPLARLMPELSLYSVVSVAALAVDLVVFKAALMSGLGAALAGIVGYAVGLVLHYTLSSRYVFRAAGLTKSGPRRFIEFALSGCVGLAMTWAVIHAATDIAQLPPMIGKIAAVASSFIVVFLLRRGIVFAGRQGAHGTVALERR